MRSKGTMILISLILVFALCACNSTLAIRKTTDVPETILAPETTNATENTPTPSPTPVLSMEERIATITLSNLPVIDGSTVTIPLAISLIREVTGCSEAKAEESIKFNTTDPSYHALAERRSDLLLVYEPSQPTIDELNVFETMDVREIGLDALVFIVNEDNPVTSLTAEQIRGIYSGKITNWKQVGGNDIEIVPFQRPALSGSQTLMLNLMMKDTAIMAPDIEVVESDVMGNNLEDVAAYNNSDNAIGYSVYYYTQNMYTQPGLKYIAVDGVFPSTETISSREYGYVDPFYGVIPLDADPKAEALLDWLLTKDGQQLLKNCGYVPIQTSLADSLPSTTDPDGQLFESKYYAVLPGEGGFYNVYNSSGVIIDSFFCDTGDSADPSGLHTIEELSGYHRMNIDEVRLVDMSGQGFYRNNLIPYENGFYQRWHGEGKEAVVFYNESGKHIYTLVLKDNKDRRYFCPDVVAYHDEILIRVIDVPADKENYSDEDTNTTLYFLSKHGKLKDKTILPSASDLFIIGRKYYSKRWSDDTIRDSSGNVIVEDVSFELAEAGWFGWDSPWTFFVFDYYMKDGILHDATFQPVKKDTLDRDGNMIYGVEYDVSGISCRAFYNMDGRIYDSYTEELVAVGEEGDQIGIKTKWGEYVLPKKSGTEFCGVNRYHYLLIEETDEDYIYYVYSLKTGEFVRQLEGKQFSVSMGEEYFIHNYRDIYDKDGNCRYSGDSAVAWVLHGENILLRRGPYIGIADLNGEWIIKTLKWELTRDAAAPESEW